MNTEIKPEQSPELLKALHILTRDGKLNQDSRRKLKQIYHLYHFIEPLLQELVDAGGEFSLADHGAGKSYLGFILYDLFFKSREVGSGGGNTLGMLYGIERRAELVTQAQVLACQLAFARMAFLNLSVEASMSSPDLPAKVHMVTALHACDTATDDAIRFALHKEAQFIVLVPCCQAEVASVMRQNKSASLAKTPLAEIWRHPIHTREFGSQLTNVLRCLLLEAHGYTLTVTELVGWEHSMKNELIIARRGQVPRGNARQRAEQILQELNLPELLPRFVY
ncbi:MAG: SAM-dependent methyltransferase [Rugosibacter sp.]|nr:SAM-dependent methyltransferase [Rugosibacter sp.]